MNGTHLAVFLALAGLAATLLKSASDIIWRPTAGGFPEWVGYMMVMVAVMAAVAALGVLVDSVNRGPRWLRRIVQGVMTPADTKPYHDMPIANVVLRVCPHLTDDATPDRAMAQSW